MLSRIHLLFSSLPIESMVSARPGPIPAIQKRKHQVVISKDVAWATAAACSIRKPDLSQQQQLQILGQEARMSVIRPESV